MQRFFGLLVTITGAALVLWAGYYVMTGESTAPLRITDDFTVTATAGGLVGVALFTVGLIWVRD